MFSISDDFLDALLPGGESDVSRSDGCWESKIAEGTHGERTQQSKIPVKRRLILSLPTVSGFYNCLIKEHTITECR